MSKNYYLFVLENILNEKIRDNTNILIYLSNYFNPYEYFCHLIKKKKLKIFVLIDNNEIIDRLNEEIKGEDCEDNILFINKEENINNIKFHNIILFHLFSYDYLEDKLKQIKLISNNNTNIFIYSSLSNEKNTQIEYKNKIRDKINKFTTYKIGNLLFLTKVLEIINENEYLIESINIHKKNNYLLYGDNTVYKLYIKNK
jgi:hypothetical protein